MKKKFTAFICLIMTFIMSLACFSGCNLVTTDSERDMQQVVAEISIENGVKDVIYKQDIIISFVNYGYNYIQNGYTKEQTINILVDDLINSRILIQNAMKEMAKDNDAIKAEDAFKIEKHLTEDEKTEAEYNAINTVIETIKAFNENKKTVQQDSAFNDIRTTPKNAVKSEKELSITEKKEFIDKYKASRITAKLDSTNTEEVNEYRESFNRMIDMLKVNNLLGNYDGRDLMTSRYFELTSAQQFENALLQKYTAKMQKGIRAKTTFADLQNEFLDMLSEQQDWDNEKFVSALENSSALEPVLFGVNGTYGHVYNLLLGVSTLQDTKIKAIDKNLSIQESEQARREILEGTTVTDLRTSWITAGYDFDGEKFTGDYTFTSPENSLKYQGTVTLAKGSDDDNKQYSAVPDTMDLSTFVAKMEEYVYGSTQEGLAEYSQGSYYKGVKYDGEVSEYNDKMQELLFAFSTDTGSLNNNSGYLIKPPVDGDKTETYVETFANAGRKLLDMGGKSYIIVASNYGYHVMFFSQVYSVNKNVADTLVEYLDKKFDVGDYASWEEYYNAMLENWDEWEDTNNFLYLLQDSLTTTKISNEISNYETTIKNKYKFDQKGCVVKYEKAYADLIKG